MKRKAIMYALSIACCLMTVANSFAQNVGISNSNVPPDNSAMLDVTSTEKGMLIPRMTEAERNLIPSPAMGLQVFNLTTKCLNMWIGNTWKQICGDCDFNSPIPGNNGPICQGSTLNLTATSIIGATYQWSGPNGFTSTLQNPSISNATAGASGSYSVAATKNGCTSTPQSTVATVNTTPVTPTAGNDGPKCVGEILNLSATTVVGASYNWTGPNGYSASVQNPLISSAALTHAGTYNVTATVNGCISAVGITSVTINAIPATPGSISGPTGPCANSTGNVYTIVTVPGTTSYNWLVPSGAAITTNTGTSITVTFGSTSGNVTVSATNTCGTSSLSTVYITIYTSQPATPGSISGSNYVVPNATGQIYSIAAVPGANSYNWTVPSGASITANTSTSITVTFGVVPSGNITVSATNGCGTSGLSTIPIITATSPLIITTIGTTTWIPPAGITSIQLLVVGGGGAGSGYGGGGGGGGVIYEAACPVTAGNSYSIVVGAGGVRPATHAEVGGQGGQSSAFGQIATGGCGGRSSDPGSPSSTPGANGGGGGSRSDGYSGTIPTAIRSGIAYGGFSGGRGMEGPNYPSGGGGGANGNGQSNPNSTTAGTGGPGIANNITGTLLYWGGGGSGMQYYYGNGAQGGLGGGGGGWPNGAGGTGGLNTSSPAQPRSGQLGGDGAPNTGGGGGAGAGETGSDNTAGNGGSGVVIIKY